MVCEENFGSGSFTERTAVRPSRESSPVVATFSFFASQLLLDVVVQRARERGAETGQMRAAVLLRNVVGVAEHGLLVGVVPLQRHSTPIAVAVRWNQNDGIVDRRLVAVQVLDEGADAALVLEHVSRLSSRSSISSMRTPEFRNDSSRRRLARMS